MSTEAREVRPGGRAPEGATPDMIESTLSSNREALDHTLTEIQERLSAEGLMQMASERLRSESGVQFMRGLRDTVVHNPMPVTVIALGMVWAAMSERSGGSSQRLGSRAGSSSPDEFASHAKGKAEQARAAGSGRWQSARERTMEMMRRRRESSGQSSQSQSGPSGQVSQWSQTAIARSRESASRGWEFTREHPVLMAGAGIAVGAAVAALLPTTRMERERLGPVRDETLRGGSRFASEAGRGAMSGVSEGELSAEDDSAQSEWAAQAERPVGSGPRPEPKRNPEAEPHSQTTEEPGYRPS